MFSERRFALTQGVIAALSTAPTQPVCTVLFVHGWLDNAASFTPLMQQMQEQFPHAQLLAIDLPGHGLSSHATSGYYPFHDYIDTLHQVILQLESEQPLAIVGHSMGALIASCYCAAFPEYVEHLVQIEGYGPLSEAQCHSIERLRKGVQSRHRLANKPPRYFNSVEAMVALRAARYNLPPEAVTPLVMRDSHRTDKGWQWRHDIKLKASSLYRMSEQHAQQVIDALPSSNLLIIGDKGMAHLSERSRAKSNTLTVAGGHHCHISQALLVSTAIIELISCS
ncbi:alpha/beta fold hydrolase [Vibrio rarus]|uniref:alpha/beta fold hydrolase n=1 Tax=Vibrio rarus TaxID=413403 RepID=UPI0021C30764|nr:alpha/beta hydrolase [Vibrio rarus]